MATSAAADYAAAGSPGAAVVPSPTGTAAATGNQNTIAPRIAAFTYVGCSAAIISVAVVARTTLATAVVISMSVEVFTADEDVQLLTRADRYDSGHFPT
jgi:hypothetical protein